MRKVFVFVSLFALVFAVCTDDASARGGRRGRRGGGCGGCGGYDGGCGSGYYAGGCGGGYHAGGYHGGYYAQDGQFVPDAAFAGVHGIDTRQSFYAGPGQQQATMFTVLVDQPDAEILIDGTPTQQRGLQRMFQTPPQAGDNVSYTIKARWNEGGKMVERERRLQLVRGQMNTVDFRANATPINTPSTNTPSTNTPSTNTPLSKTAPAPLPR